MGVAVSWTYFPFTCLIFRSLHPRIPASFIILSFSPYFSPTSRLIHGNRKRCEKASRSGPCAAGHSLLRLRKGRMCLFAGVPKCWLEENCNDGPHLAASGQIRIFGPHAQIFECLTPKWMSSRFNQTMWPTSCHFAQIAHRLRRNLRASALVSWEAQRVRGQVSSREICTSNDREEHYAKQTSSSHLVPFYNHFLIRDSLVSVSSWKKHFLAFLLPFLPSQELKDLKPSKIIYHLGLQAIWFFLLQQLQVIFKPSENPVIPSNTSTQAAKVKEIKSHSTKGIKTLRVRLNLWCWRYCEHYLSRQTMSWQPCNYDLGPFRS